MDWTSLVTNILLAVLAGLKVWSNSKLPKKDGA